MAERASDELMGVTAPGHRVARAWAQVHPGGARPEAVALIKQKNKSAIYRLTGLKMGGAAVVVKECRRETARVEQVVYGDVLSQLGISGLRYHGHAEELEGEWAWLFLEEASPDKYAPAQEEHRRLAGRWLGLLHTSAARLAGDLTLPDRGPGHYRQCLRRVHDTVVGNLGNPALSTNQVATLESLAARCETLAAQWGEVERLCAGMPRTLVHGDFIKRNLRVRAGKAGLDLVPFDWEDSGWGVPAVDLAWRPLGASADLTAYWEVVHHHWPVDLPTVRRWAAVGTLFRSLAGTDWDVPQLATPWYHKWAMRLTIYQDALADALRALGWEDGLTPASRSHMPDLAALTAGLTGVIRPAGDAAGRLTVVERRRNPNTSTFPSEVVTCRLGGEGELRLFCKYGAGRDHNAHGHRGGVAYEAEVYRHVVDPSRLPTPRYYGTHDVDGAAGDVWLILGYLDGATRLRDIKDPSAWDLAARWIGSFHAAHEASPPGPPLPFLRAYDAAYYAGWAHRAAESAGPLHGDHPWLGPLCRNFEATLAPLLEAPQTVIHGEYYPMNLLCVDGEVHPVDWESAAVASGEIDLATLTDRCDADVVGRCHLAYRKARWSSGEEPPAFARTMSLARLYVHFRWLGDRPERMKPWRLEELRALGERLGLLEPRPVTTVTDPPGGSPR